MKVIATRVLATAVAVVAIVAAPSPGAAEPTDQPATAIVGTELAPGVSFSPTQINDRGQILGQRFSGTVYDWCLYDRGRLIPLTPRARRGVYVTAALNERGEVAGTWVDTNEPSVVARPFLWSRGRAVDLSAAGNAVVVAMSDRGQLLMRAVPPPDVDDPLDPARRPFVWERGRIIPSPAPPADTVFDVPNPYAIRARDAMSPDGLVIGALLRLDGGPAEAALWRPGGALTPIGALGDRGSWPGFVTSTGAVVGESSGPSGARVFVWRGDTGMVDIGVPDDAARGLIVLAASDRGVLVVSDRERRFLWRAGRFTEIGAPPGAEVEGVNDRGQVLLTIRTPEPPYGRRAVAWHDGRLVDLDDPAAGGGQTIPVDIDERGVVVGFGQVGDQDYRLLQWRLPSGRGPR